MLLAMGLAAFLCIGIGVYPDPLYAMLPFPVDYTPYTTTHVVTTLQLLLFSGLAFATLQRSGLYPPELRSTVLDFDFSYRWIAPRLVGWIMNGGGLVWTQLTNKFLQMAQSLTTLVFGYFGPSGLLSRTWPTGSMVLWAAVLLGFTLVLYY